jgi:signal transduction histidine kinase
MDGILRQVLGFAVWGSLSATVVLGAFLLVQAIVDPPRRWKFGIFSAAMWFLASLDLSFSLGRLTPGAYEQLRLLWSGAYAGSVLLLFGYSLRAAAGAAVALPALGFAVFYGIDPQIATTIAYPLAFGLISTVHARKYLKDRGYASALLAGSSASQAVMCALYYTVLTKQNPTILVLGYAHYMQVTILAVVLGWVHLPREIRGRAPVKMSFPYACSYFAAILVGELLIQLGLLVHLTPVPWLYLAGVAFQVMVTLAYYFAHRHQLVIHADNVSQLLEDRTVELRAAQSELAKQNDRLAERLAEQERDLRAKTEVIDRQRRLELAAQTAGQVAHDIQNMISPILSRIDELEETQTLPDVREKCTGMRKQVGQLLDLNTHLLALSRRGRVELQPVYLSDVVRDVLDRFPGQRITVDAKGRPWIKGSASQLSRALSNLLTNAIESDLDRVVPVTVRWGVAELAQSKLGRRGARPEQAVPPGIPRPRALRDPGGRGPGTGDPEGAHGQDLRAVLLLQGREASQRLGSGTDHRHRRDGRSQGGPGPRDRFPGDAVHALFSRDRPPARGGGSGETVAIGDRACRRRRQLRPPGLRRSAEAGGVYGDRCRERSPGDPDRAGPAGGRDPARLQHAAHERPRDVLRRDARASRREGGGSFELCP